MAVKVKQVDRDFRGHVLKHIVDALERPCGDGDMIEDRQDALDLLLAEFRIAAEARAYAAAKEQAAVVARDKAWSTEEWWNPAFEFIATAIEAMEPTDDND